MQPTRKLQLRNQFRLRGRSVAERADRFWVYAPAGSEGVRRRSNNWFLINAKICDFASPPSIPFERAGSNPNNEVWSAIVLRISEFRLNRTFTLYRKKAFKPDLVR